MQLHIQNFGSARVVKLSGRIDHDNSEEFKIALQPHLENRKEGGEVVILDFSDVNYISSGGFRALLLAHRHAVTHNSAFNPLLNVQAAGFSGPADSWRIGGLGVPMIAEIARNLSYQRTANRNRLSLMLPLRES